MVLDAGDNGKFRPYHNEGIWGVPFLFVYTKPWRIQQLSYIRMLILARDKRDAAVWYSWKNEAVDTTTNKWTPK